MRPDASFIAWLQIEILFRYRVSPVEAVPVCLARSSSTAAWAAARRAVSSRNGEQET
jgi:hypothetical protein